MYSFCIAVQWYVKLLGCSIIMLFISSQVVDKFRLSTLNMRKKEYMYKITAVWGNTVNQKIFVLQIFTEADGQRKFFNAEISYTRTW